MRRLLLALLALPLTACLGLGGGEVVDTYALRAPTIEPAGGSAPVQLVVEVPVTDALLDETAIVHADGAARGVIGGVRWADRPPRMLQALLVQAIESGGVVTAVARAGEGVRGDHALHGELRAFQSETGASVRVAFTLRLVARGEGRVVATRRFESAQSHAGGDAAAIEAFQAAIDSLLPQVVEWVGGTLQASR